MKPKRMNVQDIAEILLDELDKLEGTAKTIQQANQETKKVLAMVGDQLTRLEKTPVRVDTKPIEASLKRFETLYAEKAFGT